TPVPPTGDRRSRRRAPDRGEVFQKRPDGPERLLRSGLGAGDADRLPDELRDPCGDLTRPRERFEFGPGGLRRIGLVQIPDLDQGLSEGGEGDALAVRETPAPDDGRTIAEILHEGGH